MIEPHPLVALIHAVPTGARVAQEALAQEFPQATVWNVLDDRLLDDARAAGGLTDALRRRMLRLIGHVVHGGVQGLPLTCSSYGEVVDTARTLWGVPVLKSDEAMFKAALAGPYRRIAVLASTSPAVPAAVAQLEALVPEVRPGRAYAEALISHKELDERLHQVLTARTPGELVPALASLPEEQPEVTSTIAAAGGRIKRRGAWRVPRILKVGSAYGRARLDLSVPHARR